jgi:cytochrome-b5 reductase
MGNISKMFGELSIGDTVNVRGPKGQFNYSPNMCRAIGMIAGGTGITPMLQVRPISLLFSFCSIAV